MGAVTPDLLLRAYASGLFPMAASREDSRLHWLDPDPRGVIPLGGFHISRSLRRRLLSGIFTASTDRDFAGVLDGCADRAETWINAEIRALYLALHRRGHAHSLEIWAEGELAGGVYGVALGGAFFGESMFSRRTDASKAALAWLVDRLRRAGFTLFDTQFLTPHLASLGAVEIPRAEYRRQLEAALAIRTAFDAVPLASAQELVQRSSQTS